MACTDSGRCCDGANCTVTKQCLCKCKSGSVFTVGGTCATGTCVSGSTCTGGVTPCDCATGTFTAGATCDCRIYPGICDSANCYSCNASTGACYYACPYPRVCCSGACCMESQYCSGGSCVNRCSAGQRYCRTSYSPYAYTCCPSGQDCCSGVCTATTTYSVNLPSGTLTWVNAGVTLTASQYVTITATGTISWTQASGSFTSGPNGNSAAGAVQADPAFTAAAILATSGSGTVQAGSSYGGTLGAGNLQLRINLDYLLVGTQSGSYSVTVVVHGCDPGAAPLGEAIVFTTASPPAPTPDGGPGTELKTLLRYMGIVATPNCSCNARAAEMDQKEMESPGWCEANMDTILGWLQEQAQNRGLPFIRPAAKLLVKRAISLAKRKSARKGIST